MRTTLAMTVAGLLAAGLWILMEPTLGAAEQQATGAGAPALVAPPSSATAEGSACDRALHGSAERAQDPACTERRVLR